MYIGQVRSFTLEFSYSHDANVGHLVKSRALTNNILYNKLMDGADRHVEPRARPAQRRRLVRHRQRDREGPQAPNSTTLSYAEEGAANPVQQLYVVNNTFVNDLGRGTFVSVSGSPADVRLVNNIFAGGGPCSRARAR